MKNLLTFILILAYWSDLSAQSCIDATPPGIPLPPANTKTYWNWKGDDATKLDGTGNYFFRQEFGASMGLVSHFSPFSAGGNQPNTSQFTNLPLDFEEGDGWELAYRYFGEIQPCVISSTNTPFFALYNRNTGILRIFITLTSNLKGNGAAISLSGSSQLKNSAALAYGDEIVAPLQIFNVYPGEQKFVNQAISCGAGTNCKTWYYGDFKIFYDPCICQNQVSWEIKFDLITTQQIKWETNGIEEQILGPGALGSKRNTLLTIAQGVGGAATGAIKAGKQGYKQGESFESDANNWLQENNECFWPDTDDLFSSSGVRRLTSLLGASPIVGAAFGAASFLSTAFGFLKKDEGTVVTPYKSKIQEITDGYITAGSNPFIKTFKLPGSLKQERHECINGIENGPLIEDLSLRKPIYDRPLGVVSLITPVKMEYVQYTGNGELRRKTDNGFGYNYDYVTPNPVREYRLANNLKFAVNPASDLEIESIEAAFYFDFPNMPADNCTEVGWRYPTSDYGPFVLGRLLAYGPFFAKSLFNDDDRPAVGNCGSSGSFLSHVVEHYRSSSVEIFTAADRIKCQPSFPEPWIERVNIKDVKFKSVTVPIELLRAYSFKLYDDGSDPFEKIKFNIFLKHRTTGKKYLEIVSYSVRPEDVFRSSLDPLNLIYDCETYTSTCSDEGTVSYQHYPVSISNSPFIGTLVAYPQIFVLAIRLLAQVRLPFTKFTLARILPFLLLFQTLL